MTAKVHVPLDIPDGDVVTPSNDLSWDFLNRTSTGSFIDCDTAIKPTGFDASYRTQSLTSEECNLRSYQSDIYQGTSLLLYIPAKPAVATTIFQVRTITVGAFNGRADMSLMVAPDMTTTVAVTSNGADLAAGAFAAGTGVLNVASTTSFSPGSVAYPGTISVPTSGTSPTVLSYTGKTSTTFTGCQWISGSGTVTTGATVTQEAGIRLSLPLATAWVAPGYPVASWFRVEAFVKMGTTTSNGELHFGMFPTIDSTTPDSAYENLAASTGLQSERVQYEVTAHGRCSSVVADTTAFQWVAKDLSGSDIGAIGTHVFTQPDPDPGPDPDPDPPPTPSTTIPRLESFTFDGANWS